MKYEHVLALSPYRKSSTSILGLFPPTGLEYVATSMKDLVGKITLLDLEHEPDYQDLEVLNEFIRNEIDLLCVSIIWDHQFDRVCELVSGLPGNVPTVVGGYKATEEVEYLFDRCPNIDVIVRGEGEDTIKEVVTGRSYGDIPGISYRDNGAVIHNDKRPLPDINTIAFPDRSLRRCDYNLVLNDTRVTNLTFDTVLTTRGCPFKCKFCTFSLNPLGQKRNYTERPLESVIEELKNVTAEVVLFSDDNFFTNPRRSEELCDLIIENDIKKSFLVQTRIDIANNPRLLEKAEKAGFKVFLIGIESPHDRILDQLQKGFTCQEVREAFKVLNRFNFYIHAYFIYGNIGETEEEMLYIAEFAEELKVDSITFQKLRIEKFSPLKEFVEKTPGYYYDRVGGPVYSDQFDLKTLKEISQKIKFRFYTLSRVRAILKKGYRIGLLRRADLTHLLCRLPLILARVLKREIWEKRRFSNTMRHILKKNQ
jgi:radical SAM superfamily enzyme YgiQ (UPF0313 family)